MRILMLTEHCCSRVIKMGIALGKRGHTVHYLNKRLSNPGFAPSLTMFGEYVDDRHLSEKLSRIDGYDLIHVHNEPDRIGVIAKTVRPDMKIVFDAHDLFSVRIGTVYGDERFCFENLDGFVFPSKGYMRHANDTYDIGGKPQAVVYSMPNEEFIQKPCNAILNAIGYQGGLRIPEELDIPEQFKYHAYRDFRSTFSYITGRLNIPMIVFPANMDAMETYANTGALMMHTHEYSALMSKLPMCRWALVGGPGKFKQWDWAMPNKLFEFMAAGVPIIAINSEEICEFVNRWQVGVCVDSLDEIPSIFNDSQKYRANLWFLQKKFTMENEVGKIEELYMEVLR